MDVKQFFEFSESRTYGLASEKDGHGKKSSKGAGGKETDDKDENKVVYDGLLPTLLSQCVEKSQGSGGGSTTSSEKNTNKNYIWTQNV